MVVFKKIELFKIRIPLITPFRTSFGTYHDKEAILLKVTDSNGLAGWGEVSLSAEPGYCYEDNTTAWHILTEFLIPILRKVNTQEEKFLKTADLINEYQSLVASIRGHNFAKAGLEFALWALRAQQEKKSLPTLLQASKTHIPAGISLGIQPSPEILLEQVTKALELNYQRIKIKIEPKNDIKYISYIRKELGDFPLMVDANSAYSLEKDLDTLKKLDKFDLIMIEQPLGHDDIIDHATLQKEIQTAVCLDESIHSLDDARKALQIGACKIINIKAGRVGGLRESLRLANYCKSRNVPVWCGGMLESGVGRIINIALQANDAFSLPGDTSASKRYFFKDIIEPEVVIEPNGTIKVELEYRILEDSISGISTKKETYNL